MNSYRTSKRLAQYDRELQDRAEIIERPHSLVLVVADGAGGTGGGSQAADMVLEKVRQWAESETLFDEADWCRCLSEIDSAIEADPKAGETTAVIVSVESTRIVGASVGDSAAWVITSEGYQPLTRHQHHKPLLGSGAAIPIPFSADLHDGTLLLASDGLINYAPAESICQIAREEDLDTAAIHLLERVRVPTGALWDDVAILLFRREDNSTSNP